MFGVAILGTAVSCLQELNGPEATKLSGVVLNAPGFEWVEGVSTKTNISDAAAFTWADGDIVGIYPDVGTQVKFPIVGMGGQFSNSANFTGGGWAVKNANHYMAYYPFIPDMDLDKEAVPVDYTNQCQDGSNSTAHLSPFDFMAAGASSPTDGEISFSFEHMSSFLKLDLTVPKIAEYKTLTLSCTETPFITKGTVDITAPTPSITPTHYSNEFVVNLTNVTTTVVNQHVIIFLLMPPVDMSGRTIRVNLRGDHADCQTSFTRGDGKPFRPGKAYAPTMNPMEGGDIIKLEDGPDFNVDIKSLVNGEHYIYDKTDYRIQSISFEVNNSAEPELPHIDVSAPDSPAPIYAYWNSSTRELVIRTMANKVYTGYNAAGLFNKLDGLTSIDITNLDLTYANSIQAIFKGCAHLTSLDLTPWNTSHIEYLHDLFWGCKRLATLDISNFDTENAVTLQSMFRECEALTSLDLRHFKTTNALWGLDNMFNGCSNLASIQFSNNFHTNNVGSFLYMFAGCTALSSLDISMFNTTNASDMRGMFSGCENLATLTGDINVTDKNTDLEYMFFNCRSLPSLDVSDWDVSNVTRLVWTFCGCSSLASLDVSDWSVGNVTTFENLFNGCSSLLSLDVSKWNTSEGVSFYGMFDGCSGLTTLDVSDFVTNNAVTFEAMFSGCSSLTAIDVSNFVTTNANYTRRMFEGCSSVASLDVSNFDTSQVINMSYMFSGCSSLTSVDFGPFEPNPDPNLMSIYIGGFDTHYCEDFAGMFNNTGFTSLNLSFFDTSSAKSFLDMFGECHSLTSLDISSFNTEHVTNNLLSFIADCYVLADINFGPNFDLIGPWYFAIDLARDIPTCTIHCSQDFKNAWYSTEGVYYSSPATLVWLDATTGDPLI